MRRVFVLGWLVSAGLLAASCTAASRSSPDGVIQVDILFGTEAGVPEVLSQLDTILAPFSRRTHVTRYDLNTPEGKAFVEEKDISDPSQLMIWINGSSTFDVNNRTVTLSGLPQGEGAGMIPDGNWTIADFAWILNETN